jgi:DNA (cytosine-5)-methyltransferase 1
MLIMENVPNLMRHEGGETWKGIRRKLIRAGYEISESKLSPDMFGVLESGLRADITRCPFGANRRHTSVGLI